MDNCVFCKIIKGELPSSKVYEDEHVIAFLDIAPINKGHTLVVPKAHSESITTVASEDQAAMMQVAPRIGAAMMRAVEADAFNLILCNGKNAGQVVMHSHLHVIPRMANDGVRIPARSVEYDSEEEKAAIVAEACKRLDS
jgi:histidine triad (HIT) family protein